MATATWHWKPIRHNNRTLSLFIVGTCFPGCCVATPLFALRASCSQGVFRAPRPSSSRRMKLQHLRGLQKASGRYRRYRRQPSAELISHPEFFLSLLGNDLASVDPRKSWVSIAFWLRWRQSSPINGVRLDTSQRRGLRTIDSDAVVSTLR